MSVIRRILCPLDFSRFSRHALEQGVALAREFGAEISALHVFTIAPVMEVVPPAGRTAIDSHYLSASARQELTAELREFTDEVDAGGVVIHTEVAEGDQVDTIVRRAEAWPADLIVMGTHGRTGLERLVLGSIAEKVLRRAPCPVLTMPRRVLSPTRALTLGRLLCAVDFSEESLRALRYAAALAAPAGPGLCVLNVVELFGATRDLASLEIPNFRVELVRAARARLEAAVPADARALCPIADDGEPIQAVVPADREVDLDRLIELAGASQLRLAYESELDWLYPDCARGAMPPFGPLYGQRLFIDEALTREEEIVFNGGTHTDAICMRYGDFAELARPIVGEFAVRPFAIV